MNWLDWLILAILALSAWQGLRCGFVGSVAKLAGILAGFGVAVAYYHELAAYLNNHWNLTGKILPLAKNILGLWFPAKATSAAIQISPVAGYVDYAASVLAASLINAISFLALLFITVWLVNLAGIILTKAAALAFLGPFNRAGGLLFGAAKGLVAAMIVLTLLAPFQGISSLRDNSPGEPGITRSKGNAFSESKVLPYFEPLFKAINRPLPGSLPEKTNQSNPVKSI